MLGSNLVRNPDCVLSLGQWGSGSLGPDDCISFNGELNIASQQSVISDPGNYMLTLTYESDSPFGAKVGNAGFQTVPASAGGVFETVFAVASGDGIVFRDGNESAVGRILRAELRKVTAAA